MLFFDAQQGETQGFSKRAVRDGKSLMRILGMGYRSREEARKEKEGKECLLAVFCRRF